MRKEEFFKLLKTRLAVIEENELEDILSEYRQHIDMKMQSGVSEEEAIKDFGDVDVLADEILESYHVRIDYDGKKENKETIKEIKEKSQSFFGKISAYVKNGFFAAGSFFKRIFLSTGAFFKRVFLKVKSLFKREKQEALSEEKKSGTGIWHNIKFSVKALWLSLVSLIKWSFRICFNILLIFLGSMAALVSAFALLSLGFSLVLLISGYPAVGITVTSLGLSSVFISLSMLAFLSVKRKKSAAIPQKEGENNDKA